MHSYTDKPTKCTGCELFIPSFYTSENMGFTEDAELMWHKILTRAVVFIRRV